MIIPSLSMQARKLKLYLPIAGKPSVTKVFITWHEAVKFDLIATAESDELRE